MNNPLKDHPVKSEDVMRSFLASNESKNISEIVSSKDKIKKINFIHDSWKDKDLDFLCDKIDYAPRLKRFLGFTWFKKNVDLKNIGGWYLDGAVGDLPDEWCQGSVVDIANRISQNKDFKSKSITKIYQMVPIIDSILENFPPILVNGGTIRKSDDLLFLPFDADDGSHRSIAAVLAGKEGITVFVGLT